MDQPDPTNPPAIRILRAGTFTSVEGKAITFGQAELEAIAAGYDADADPAPLVIGHPKMDDPAYGWVGSLAVEDGELVARPSAIDPSFAERVRKGDYRKVSARLYEPNNPHNPKPGAFYLKHVGFLGAHAPGVKSLGTVQFAEGEPDTLVTIQTEPEETVMTGKTTDTAKPADNAEASFAEREARLAERESAITQRETEHRTAAAKARHDDNVSFAETLIGAAKLAPAGKELLVGVLDQLGELDANATVSFGEGQSLRPAAALKKLFDGARPLVSLGEAAPREKTGAGVASFAAPAGYEVDPAQAQLHADAKRIQAAAPNRPWMDCVREAQAAAA